MRSRKLKHFPSGTFLPTRQRLLAILQLCIAFSLICWYIAQPFMGEYFALRSRQLLYEYSMGTSEILKKDPNQSDKINRQKERFASLPQSEKTMILEDYKTLQEYAGRSFWKKMQEGLNVLLFSIPPFELAWLVFSVAITILLLLKVEGARQAVWLLPCIVLAFAIDNRLTGHIPLSSPDLKLFPKEEIIIQNYLEAPLNGSILQQRDQLKRGWELYLVANWLPVSSHATEWEQKVEEAEFAFTLARLHQLHGQPKTKWFTSFREQLSLLQLSLYLLWNLFFAWQMSRPFNSLSRSFSKSF